MMFGRLHSPVVSLQNVEHGKPGAKAHPVKDTRKFRRLIFFIYLQPPPNLPQSLGEGFLLHRGV